MTENVKSETLKATGDVRVAEQIIYDTSKVAHTIHSDVTKSIHQIKGTGMPKHTMSHNSETDIHKAASDVKVAAPDVASN